MGHGSNTREQAEDARESEQDGILVVKVPLLQPDGAKPTLGCMSIKANPLQSHHFLAVSAGENALQARGCRITDTNNLLLSGENSLQQDASVLLLS